MSKKKINNITAEELDRVFDEGKEDIMQYADLSTIHHPNQEPRRVNVDFPAWMVRALDSEAKRLGVTRQSIIKTWIGDRIDSIIEKRKPKK